MICGSAVLFPSFLVMRLFLQFCLAMHSLYVNAQLWVLPLQNNCLVISYAGWSSARPFDLICSKEISSLWSHKCQRGWLYLKDFAGWPLQLRQCSWKKGKCAVTPSPHPHTVIRTTQVCVCPRFCFQKFSFPALWPEMSQDEPWVWSLQ